MYTTQKFNEFQKSGTISRFGKSGSESNNDVSRLKSDHINDDLI